MQPSQNVEDRRGMRAGFGGGGIRTGGLGLGGLLLLMVIGYFITGDPPVGLAGELAFLSKDRVDFAASGSDGEWMDVRGGHALLVHEASFPKVPAETDA